MPMGILFEVPQILLKPGRKYLDSILSCLDPMSNSRVHLSYSHAYQVPPEIKRNIETTCFCNPFFSLQSLPDDMKSLTLKTHGSKKVPFIDHKSLSVWNHPCSVSDKRHTKALGEAKDRSTCMISVFNSWRNSDLKGSSCRFTCHWLWLIIRWFKYQRCS